MLNEFKKFAMRGHVMDMAVGVIIGGAFGKIVTSIVRDIIMPPIGLLLGGVDFSDLKIILKKATEDTEAVSVNYGIFTNTLIDFLIVSFSIFLVIKAINNLKKKEPVPEPTEKKCPECLMTIPLAAKKCAHCLSAFT